MTYGRNISSWIRHRLTYSEYNPIPMEEPPTTVEVPDKTNKKNWRNLIAYWILGLTNNYGYVVMLSAANDILAEQEHPKINTYANGTRIDEQRECNYMSTGAILLADIIPSLCIKLVAPFLPFFVNIRVAICIVLASLGFLVVAFSQSAWMSIMGVVVTSLSSGLGEVTYLQYSSFYDKDVISTWSSGTGGAGVAGSLSYAALNKLGLRTALLIMLIVPFTMLVSFWFILQRPAEFSSNIQTQTAINNEEILNPKEALIKKFKKIPGLLKYMIPLGLVYLFEYFINQGMFELINFEGISVNAADQYRWLQVDYQIGVFISRSSVNLVHIKQTWIMAALQLINVVIYTTEVIYYYIPYFWIVLLLTLWEGLLGWSICKHIL